MTTFDDREQTFEQKFAHDSEITFKVHARTYKLLGLWAAEKMHLSQEHATEYAKEVVRADFEAPGSNDVINKLLRDFTVKGLAVSRSDIVDEISKLEKIARDQLMNE